MRASDLCKLEVFDHHCLWRILCIHWKLFIISSTVCTRCRIYSFQKSPDAFVGSGMPVDDTQMISSMKSSTAPPPGWKKHCGGQLKIRLITVKQDVELILRIHFYGIRCWNREWLTFITESALNCCVWSANVRDMVDLLEHAGPTDPWWMLQL